MPQPGQWRKRWRACDGFLREIWHRFHTDRVPMTASAIAYNMLISLVPFLLLAVFIAAFFVDKSRAPEVISDFTTSLTTNLDLGGNAQKVIRDQILTLIQYRAELAGLALLFALWTGSHVFMMLEAAMNIIWHTQRQRPYWIRRGLALLMLPIVGILLLGAVFLTNVVRLVSRVHLPFIIFGHNLVGVLVKGILTIAIPLLLMATICGTIYRILPTKRVTVRSVVPGAVFAASLWLIFIHLFGWYTTLPGHYKNYTVLYGSLGGFILLLILLYYSAFTLVLGAEISAAYHRRLVEAGVHEEQQVEESEQVIEADKAQAQFNGRVESARESVAYYGYHSIE